MYEVLLKTLSRLQWLHHHREAPKYTDLKEGLISLWQPKMTCIIPLMLSTTGIIPNKLHRSWKLLNLCPALYILMQKVVILNMCHIVKEVLTKQWMRSALSVRPILQELNQHKSYTYKFTDTTQLHKMMMMMYCSNNFNGRYWRTMR